MGIYVTLGMAMIAMSFLGMSIYNAIKARREIDDMLYMMWKRHQIVNVEMDSFEKEKV